jgi:WD40-like Beta Propeller Repeat
VTSRGRLLALLVVPLALAACEHATPGPVSAPAALGPFSAALPRRLTFHVLNDVTPSVAGSTLVYSRQGTAYPNLGYSPDGREGCIAFMPLEGGSIQRLYCPSELLSPADTFVHTWFEPSLSPDGTQLAFTWQRGPNLGPLAIWDADLLVTPADRPTDTTGVRVVVNYSEGGVYPRRATHASKITWLGEDRLRYLATWENIYKVKGGGASRVTDTIYEPLALMELNLTTRVQTPVPGGDSVVAYAAAPSGGIWVVRESHPDSLLLLDPTTGVRTPVGAFSSRALDLIALDGAPVAVVDPVIETGPVNDQIVTIHGGAAIERLDPQTGTRTQLTGFTGPVRHIAAAGGKRLVAEIEQALLPFGPPADLWLLEFP